MRQDSRTLPEEDIDAHEEIESREDIAAIE
jgi:hypothetical protein